MAVSLIPLNVAASGTLPAANAPSGSVIQVVQTISSNQLSTTSTSFVAFTQVQASITPKFSTSKILIFMHIQHTNTSQAGASCQATIYRNSTTNLATAGTNLALTGHENQLPSGYVWIPSSLCFLDSPATTSSTTYTLYGKVASGTGYFGWNADNQVVTLMEIAA